jgi:hypothetical protein
MRAGHEAAGIRYGVCDRASVFGIVRVGRHEAHFRERGRTGRCLRGGSTRRYRKEKHKE